MNEFWETTGPVPISHWPDERFGYGFQSVDTKIKLGTAIHAEYAERLVADHNKLIRSGQAEHTEQAAWRRQRNLGNGVPTD